MYKTEEEVIKEALDLLKDFQDGKVYSQKSSPITSNITSNMDEEILDVIPNISNQNTEIGSKQKKQQSFNKTKEILKKVADDEAADDIFSADKKKKRIKCSF